MELLVSEKNAKFTAVSIGELIYSGNWLIQAFLPKLYCVDPFFWLHGYVKCPRTHTMTHTLESSASRSIYVTVDYRSNSSSCAV